MWMFKNIFLNIETNKTEWYHPSIDRKQALGRELSIIIFLVSFEIYTKLFILLLKVIIIHLFIRKFFKVLK